MNRIDDYLKLENQIIDWLKKYLKTSKMKGWVLGVSGGIDSAVASTLVAKTGAPVLILELPIKQKENQVNRAKDHIKWLKEKYNNVNSKEIDLTFNIVNEGGENLTDLLDLFSMLMEKINYGLDSDRGTEISNLAEANSRSRLRMLMLYYAGTITNSLVVGTGNKVEDFGVGFYTKYGDGGVDLSPLADLYKTEVRELGKHFGIIDSIIKSKPTDGLWDDGRTDEDQLGATYEELEWAMDWIEVNFGENTFTYSLEDLSELTSVQQNALKIYKKRYNANHHKMINIPVFKLKT